MITYTYNSKYILFPLIFTGILILFSCTKREEATPEQIIARIGDKTISLKEFRARAEFTIRPNPYKNKYTTLNNLITEKILALEAGENNELSQNPYFLAQIEGLKEQNMREQLYFDTAYNQVQVDTNEIKQEYRYSIREYDLDFFSIRRDDIGESLQERVQASQDSIKQIFALLSQHGKMGQQTVKWKDSDFPQINEALYAGPLEVNSVIGPIRLEENNWIFMRVKDWRDYPIISGEDQQRHWNEVQEKIHQRKAIKKWHQFAAQVMQGKKLDFKKETFNKLADLIFEKMFNANNQADIKKKESEFDSLEIKLSQSEEMQAMLPLPFFSIDNETWTVADFKQAIMKHPLVYRTRDISRRNFRKQFQYAIADLIRDHFLTKEAYQRHLDQHYEVKRTESMWKDAYVSISQRNVILKSAPVIGNNDYEKQASRRNYWIAQIDSLQKAYAPQIEINHNLLETVELTTVDMYATRPGLPYPVPVPPFPQISTSGNLDYAK